MTALTEDGTVVVWNRAAVEAFGWGAADIVGRASSVIPADVVAAAAERARTDAPYSTAAPCRRRDGKLLWANVTMTPVRDSESGVTLLLAVVRDGGDRDDDRRRLQQSAAVTAFAQRASRERTHEAVADAAVEHLAAALQADYVDLLTDVEGQHGTVRHAFGWGRAVAPHARVAIESTIYADALERCEPVVRELTARDFNTAPHLRQLGVRWAAATLVRLRSQRCTLAAFSKLPLSENDVYALESIAAMCEASSARREAEHQLAASERTLRMMLEQMPAVIWTMDRDQRVTMVQGAGLRPAGAEPDHAIGRLLDELVPPGDDRQRAVARAINGESAWFLGTYGGCAYESRVEPLRDAHGSVIGAMGLTLDVTERRRHEETLRASREELRRLSARMHQLQEEERRRISHELHDELGQRLTALRMETGLLPHKLGDRCTEAASVAIKSMLHLIDDTIVTVRRVATELRPPTLDHFGFRSALEHELASFEKRSGVAYEIEISPDDLVVDSHRTTALYRIAQESLTNVARHAAATFVRVSLEERDDAIVLEIADNGRGIADGDLTSSSALGLIGMRERAHAHGGSLEVRRAAGGGTVVSVVLPNRGGA